MQKWKQWVALAGAVLAYFPGWAQELNNDGFQRRNGQMYVVRNGQPRAMTRDVHLPTGTVVTKDGFLVAAGGARTELREGQGCDLRGRPVQVQQSATGALTLAVRPPGATRRDDDEGEGRDILARLFGDDDGRGKKWNKGRGYWKKKGKGRGKKHDDDD